MTDIPGPKAPSYKDVLTRSELDNYSTYKSFAEDSTCKSFAEVCDMYANVILLAGFLRSLGEGDSLPIDSGLILIHEKIEDNKGVSFVLSSRTEDALLAALKSNKAAREIIKKTGINLNREVTDLSDLDSSTYEGLVEFTLLDKEAMIDYFTKQKRSHLLRRKLNRELSEYLQDQIYPLTESYLDEDTNAVLFDEINRTARKLSEALKSLEDAGNTSLQQRRKAFDNTNTVLLEYIDSKKTFETVKPFIKNMQQLSKQLEENMPQELKGTFEIVIDHMKDIASIIKDYDIQVAYENSQEHRRGDGTARTPGLG